MSEKPEQTERQRKDAERKRRAYHQANHGVSLEEIDEQKEAQNWLCASCSEQLQDGKRCAVDTNSRSGRFKGVLCMRCLALKRMAGDDAALLRAVADYVENLKPLQREPIVSTDYETSDNYETYAP